MLRSFKAIGELIHYYRLINGYSQQDLANKLHVTISAVSSWERGVSRPGIEIAYELSRDMNMTLDEFYTGNIKVKDSSYYLSDQIKFSHAFMDVVHLELNEEETELNLYFNLYGIHVQKNMIDDHLFLTIESNERISKPIYTDVQEIPFQQKMASPELSQMALRSKNFLIKTRFSYKPFSPVKCFIKYNQESITLNLTGEVIELLTEGPPFDENNLEVTLKFLESESFKEGLKFMSKTQGTNHLQAFMVNQYKYLMDYLAQTKKKSN